MATFDYTSRDYLSIRQDLINRAAITIPEWDGADASEFANVFVDLWAYMGDVLHFYIDRAAAETFLSTATQRESVMAIANLMDYIPASSRASRGTAVVKLNSFPESSVQTRVISSAVISTVSIGGVNTDIVTFTTTTNHDLTANQLVSISEMSPSGFNQANVIIYSAPTATTFVLLRSQFTNVISGNSTTGGTLSYNIAYTLPQYTTFSGYNADNTEISFYAPSSTTFTTVGAKSTISLVQGTIISNEALGLSTGKPNQVYTLMKKNVDNDSITIQVYEGSLLGGVPTPITYQYVSQLSTSNFVDKVFTTKVTSDGYTQILFGNSFNGFVPTTNASMTASYRTTIGSVGNLPSGSIKFVNGTPSSYVSIDSSGAMYGGADQESIESIRTNVSKLYRTQDRAVSLQDYKDLLLQTPGVSRSTAQYGKGDALTVSGTVSGTTVTFTSSTNHGFVAGQYVNIDGGSGSSYVLDGGVIESVPTGTTFTVNTASYNISPTGTTTGATASTINTVVLYPVPHQSSYPPAPITAGSQKVVIEIPTPMVEYVENYFSTRSILGVTSLVTNQVDHGTIDRYIECTPIYVGMQVYVKSTYVQSWVKDDVVEAVKNLLSFENIYFGQTLTIGEVYRAALNVTGVDYVVLTNLSTTYDPTPDSVGTVSNVTVDATKIPCFTDLMDYSALSVTDAPAVNLVMYGGITGSN
jgi:hypothetical protein